MKSFHNKQETKQKYLDRLELHYKQDEIIKGQYWENGKGCAVGCTVHSNSHQCYEKELGIPEWLARLEDILFEKLPNGKAKEFPLQFLKAIPIGVTEKQFTILKHRFSKYLLEKQCKNTDHPTVKDAIKQVLQYHDDMINGRFESESAAESVRSAAESAAWSAVRSAAELGSPDSAAESAWSAAESARSAAIIEQSEMLIKLLKESK